MWKSERNNYKRKAMKAFSNEKPVEYINFVSFVAALVDW